MSAKIVVVKLIPIDCNFLNQSSYLYFLNYSEFLFSSSEFIFQSLPPTLLYQVHKLIILKLFQTSFWGLSGHIKFDNFGLRTNYRLNLLEVSLSRGLARVTYFHVYFLNFKTHTFMKNILFQIY